MKVKSELTSKGIVSRRIETIRLINLARGTSPGEAYSWIFNFCEVVVGGVVVVVVGERLVVCREGTSTANRVGFR